MRENDEGVDEAATKIGQLRQPPVMRQPEKTSCGSRTTTAYPLFICYIDFTFYNRLRCALAFQPKNFV